MKFVFPCPPTLNHLYGVTKDGRRYKKKAHADYMAEIQMMLVKNKIKPIAKKMIGVEIAWYRKKRIGDVDNILKTVLDSLKPQKIKAGKKVVGKTQWGYYEDDSQVDELHLYRRLDKQNPRIEVVCYEL